MRYIDVSLGLDVALPCWPGDPVPTIERIREIGPNSACNVTRIDTHVHFGTHVDAPCHFIPNGKAVDELALDAMIGPVRVVHLPDAEAIGARVLDSLDIPLDTRRLLFRTRNSLLWEQPDHAFRSDYVALTSDGAEWVVERGIRLVGVDYLSVERFKEPGRPTHTILLEAEVVVIEGLDLRGIAPGEYGLICLPMKIPGADGAPARVVLVDEHGSNGEAPTS